MKKIRQSNFELMRLLSMFMIVLWHVIKNNINFVETPDKIHFFLIVIICMIVIHVNSFVMVSGYFSSFKRTGVWKKALALLGTTWFYKGMIALIFFFFATGIVGRFELLKELFPLDLIRSYWFINCYILLLLLSPFINTLLENLTRSQHKKLVLTSFLLFSFLPFITNQTTVSNDGFNLIHFVFLYIIGAYFKKYPLEENYHFKRFSKMKMQVFSLIVFLFCVCLNVCIYFLSLHLKGIDSSFLKELGDTLYKSIFCYSSPIIMIQTVAYFQFFKMLSIQNKRINLLASFTFGIYLFHENYYLKLVLYQPFHLLEHAQRKSIFLYVFLVAFAIFLCGMLLEWIRKQIVKILSKQKWVIQIENKCLRSLKLMQEEK